LRAGEESHEQDLQENAGLLALRAGLGGVLVAHGVQKLFGWLGGHGLTGTGTAFEQMGFRPGKQSALAAGLGEACGGVLIALGLATPVAGAAAAGTMIPATAVHTPSGFFATSGGYEYPALLGVSAAALTLMGPGDWSLDAPLNNRLNRPWMSTVAIIPSSAVSLAIVQRRHQVLAARARGTSSEIQQSAPAGTATAPTDA
jgi:putative oxidoreductase